jgi:type VII secretion integral membrane protein EccD
VYRVTVPSTGLARVTISAPRRRVDVALPDGVPLVELLPEVLRHAGDGMADDGERHGGWLLRRVDGTALSPTTGLAAQGVRDGAILHLVPARAQWPELEYDDVVEAIAAGSRRYGLGWSPRATRATALVATGAALAVGLVALLRAGPPWATPALAGFGVAASLIVAGVMASRAYSDAGVGAALAAFGLPYAFVGGLLALGTTEPLAGLGRREFVLVGSAALVLASAVAAVGVGYALRLFVAGMTAGVLGTVGALVGLVTSAAGAAAAVMSLLVTGVAAVPLLAIRFGKLPMPVLTLPADLAASGRAMPPAPDRERVFAAVARTDEMLTGMLLGIAVAGAVSAAVLLGGGVSGRILVGVAAAAFLLRARLFVTLRQRLPLIGAGLAGFALLAAGAMVRGPDAGNVAVAVGLAVAALVVALAGVRYASQAPSPYLGRAADVLDALCVVSVVPVACAVLGLYGLARGIAG